MLHFYLSRPNFVLTGLFYMRLIIVLIPKKAARLEEFSPYAGQSSQSETPNKACDLSWRL